MSAPTPPPSSQPSGLSQAGPSFNVNALNIFDKIALGAGALGLIFSFFSAYVSVSIPQFCMSGTCVGGGSVGINAWHSWATVAMLISLVVLALVALKALTPSPIPGTVPMPLITAGLAGLAWIILLIRGLTYDGAHLGWSGWILVILELVVAAATIIPLTSAAGSVEAKLNDAAGKFGGQDSNNVPPSAN